MKALCLSLDLPLAYFACSGAMGSVPRRTRARAPVRVLVHAGGAYGELCEWPLCGDLPAPLYNDFVDLISDRNPGAVGRYWEIGPEGKARLRDGLELDPSERRQLELVERLRLRVRSGKAPWTSQAIVGAVTVSSCIPGRASAWGEEGGWTWEFSEPLLFEDPIPGVRGRPGLFLVEAPPIEAH
jgi:hypothetical protein